MLKAHQVAEFIHALTPEKGHGKLFLLYGQDQGAIRESAKQLITKYLGDAYDPLQLIEVNDAQCAQARAILRDEAAGISMFGGARLVNLRCKNNEAAAKAAQFFLADPVDDACVVIEAENLRPQAALRKAIEGADAGMALPFYPANARDMEHIIRNFLNTNGFQIEIAALAFLRDRASADRGILQRELERLILYMGAPSKSDAADKKRLITMEDIHLASNDLEAATIDKLVDAIALGDIARLDRMILRLKQMGNRTENMLIMVRRHFQTLHLVTAMIEAGHAQAEALRTIRPPIHFQRRPLIEQQIKLWSRRKIESALHILHMAEADCRSGKMPIDALAAYSLLRLARAGYALKR